MFSLSAVDLGGVDGRADALSRGRLDRHRSTKKPNASWGQMLPRFLAPDIAVANHAESGETLKSFLTELRLDRLLATVRAATG